MCKQPDSVTSLPCRIQPVFLLVAALCLVPAFPVWASSITIQTGDRVIGINVPEDSPFVRMEDGTLIIKSTQKPRVQEQEQQPVFIYVAPEISWPDTSKPGLRPNRPARPHPAHPVRPSQP